MSYPTRGPTERDEVIGRLRNGASDPMAYGLPMLGTGDRVPEVQVWTAPREDPRPLKQALGAGLALLCFYLWDWSPT